MKKLFISIIAVFAAVAASAQNTQDAAAQAAATLTASEDVPQKVEKPKYWNSTITTSINFGQTFLSQWAAGGYNNVSISGNLDATANYAKGKITGMNHLQLDYGQMYSADKPIFQKTKDRIYFESKWGYASQIKNLAYSGSFDFKTQFGKNFAYNTPKSDGQSEPTAEDWLNARNLKSGFFSPAYVNLGVGVLWTPAPWFSLNFSPLTGGAVFVILEELRYTYGMDLKPDSPYAEEIRHHQEEGIVTSDETEQWARKQAYEAGAYDDFKLARMELGAQLKLDAAWVINDTFSFNTQVNVFYNYLKPKVEPRINWDNKITWKLLKFFGLTFTTNLIYDPFVMVRDTDGDGKGDYKGVQFREYFEFGFVYTLNRQH